jgi:hypothetical protein
MSHRSIPLLLAAGIAVALTSPVPAAAGGHVASRSGPDNVVGLPAWDVVHTAPLETAALNGVATAGVDVWAVGTSDHASLTERWNGKRFVRVDSPNIPDRNNVLEDVAGSSATDVWAVGHADDLELGVTSRSLIEHWDGSAWRIVHSPSVRGHLNTLTGVVALSSDDAWAVGTLTNFQPGGRPILLHWNGDQWRRVRTSCAPYLNEVDARSATDIWAIGGADSCRYNGSHWVDIRLDPPNNPQYSLDMQDLTIVSASDIWAVGDEASSCGEGQVCHSGAIEHWNGKDWTYVTDNVPVLYGVDAAAANDIYAVGLAIGPAIVHYDGSGWEDVPNPYEPAQLASVAVGNGDAFAVGSQAGDHPLPFAEQAPSPKSGAVVGATNVSDATVSWFGKESGSVQTNPFGDYQIGGLKAGRYLFTASYQGCQPASVKVVVAAGQTIEQDLHIDC